jgi:trehalose synthase
VLLDYVPVVGRGEIEEIKAIAGHLQGVRVRHINSARTGGGVAEILERHVPLEHELGLDVSWEVLRGNPRFFEVTKAMHNALHGAAANLTPEDFEVYRATVAENRALVDGDFDVLVVHDPQPAGLVRERVPGRGTWIWRCHIDLSESDVTTWAFLRSLVERFDAAVFHLPKYTKDLMVPQYILPPAIDPLSAKNEEISERDAKEIVGGLGIDPELPIVLQVSRFDLLKDPVGVIEAFRMAQGWEPCQLVLAGGGADDDPEGAAVLAQVQEKAAEVSGVTELNLPPDSHREINALQRAARVVVQKSVREGFGLVVTEAMWKRRPVIGSAVGGIREQIIHGINGFLAHSTEGVAFRIRQLLSDPELCERMGAHAHEHVRMNYLLPTSLRRWLLMFLAVSRRDRGVTRLEDPLHLAGRREAPPRRRGSASRRTGT